MQQIAIIASNIALNFDNISSVFSHSQFELRVARTLSELAALLRTKSFVVFVDDTFDPDVLNFPKKFSSRSQGVKWIYCFRKGLSKTVGFQALQSGFDHVLDNPHEPEQYLLRAKQVLSKEKPKSNDFQAAVAGQATLITSNISYQERRPEWKGYAAPLATSLENISRLRGAYQNLFTKLLSEAANGEMALISTRADSPLEKSLPRLRCLVKNNWDTSENIVWNMKDYPEISLMFEKDQALYLPDLTLERADSSTFHASIAAIPVRNSQDVTVGILRAMLPRKNNQALVEYLEDLSNFANELFVGFRTLEFFARIYARDCSLYS